MDRNVTLKLATVAAGLAMAGSLLVAAPSHAAGMPPDAKEALDKAREELRADREALLDANLDLTPEEASRFWPLYREYASKRTTLGDEQIAMIVDYADAYPNVGDALAKDLVARLLKWDRKATDLRQSYAKKIGKVLPATKLMRFLQIERRIGNLIELQLQVVVPVVDLPAN
jgi:hypothetical protein